VAPSPTADATRLTERQRASPTANTPGMLVSKKKGSRSSLHPLGGWPERSKSRPSGVSLGIHLGGAREPLSMGRAPDEDE